MGVKLGTPP